MVDDINPAEPSAPQTEGNYGIVLIMGNAGLLPSTEGSQEVRPKNLWQQLVQEAWHQGERG